MPATLKNRAAGNAGIRERGSGQRWRLWQDDQHRSDMSYFRFLAVNNAPAVQFDVR